MAFELAPKKPLPDEVQRLLLDRIDAMEKHLRARRSADKRVHDARKRIKETRTLLRLLRPHLGTHFSVEDAWYRSAAHDLAPARDAAAMVEAVQLVRERGDDPAARLALARIGRILKARPPQHAEVEERIENLLGQFSYARARLASWPQLDDRFATIGDGIEETFRRGRRALRTLVANHTSEHFHDFRKRVKDHWYQTQLLRRVWPGLMKPYFDVLGELSDLLGRLHDLVVLRETLVAHKEEFGGDTTTAPAVAAIEDARTHLEYYAIAMAAPIYAEKPRQWRKRIRGYWKIAAKRSSRAGLKGIRRA